MENNPFTSKTFVDSWFEASERSFEKINLSCIKTLLFYKPYSLIPIYINAGKNLTKGIYYHFLNKDCPEFNGKTCLIYDVPEYFKINHSSQSVGVKKIKQYPGFLTYLEEYNNFDDYMLATFKRKSRSKLRKYKNRLEKSFDITYKVFHGHIEQEEYKYIFDCFKKLLEKRFDAKNQANNNLNPKEWNFYYDVAYPLILEKKAGLFVVYENKTPIAITLKYFSDKIIFGAITVFDIDFTKFHLGSISIMKNIEWSIKEGYDVLDYSKGDYFYKQRWFKTKYDFYYHIVYDKKSLKARLLANLVSYFFKFKQKMREKNLNEALSKIKYSLIKQKGKKVIDKSIDYKMEDVLEKHTIDNLISVDYFDDRHHKLKMLVFEFLYLNEENIKDTNLYRIKDSSNHYLIEGKNIKKKLVLV